MQHLFVSFRPGYEPAQVSVCEGTSGLETGLEDAPEDLGEGSSQMSTRSGRRATPRKATPPKKASKKATPPKAAEKSGSSDPAVNPGDFEMRVRPMKYYCARSAYLLCVSCLGHGQR